MKVSGTGLISTQFVARKLKQREVRESFLGKRVKGPKDPRCLISGHLFLVTG